MLLPIFCALISAAVGYIDKGKQIIFIYEYSGMLITLLINTSCYYKFIGKLFVPALYVMLKFNVPTYCRKMKPQFFAKNLLLDIEVKIFFLLFLFKDCLQKSLINT